MTDAPECFQPVNRHPVETLWREVGLPEYFLGNGGTNTKLYALYDAVMERCAKIADQVALNAQRRGAGYPGGSPAQEAAYNKMEGATDVAHAIRDRTSQVSRPTSGGAA